MKSQERVSDKDGGVAERGAPSEEMIKKTATLKSGSFSIGLYAWSENYRDLLIVLPLIETGSYDVKTVFNYEKCVGVDGKNLIFQPLYL
ncbi:hypothetical protein SAMN05660330_00223 [Desulforhopalus singaporensis]|uniref:Uncharacterized protein n=1 Tax=Desulforhopalus singaporensis TaxID=91360 RepID=A0A1H0JC78_9BACT|nr:hypothetical protein SAMN05660330_00223 [Desulforhopalus singaporensis]